MSLKRERRNTRFVEALKCCATKDTVKKEGQKKPNPEPERHGEKAKKQGPEKAEIE